MASNVRKLAIKLRKTLVSFPVFPGEAREIVASSRR